MRTVTEGSALDVEALKRGNSTYLVDGVIPMLPEHLSNDICSLVPNKPRFAYSVFMEFTAKGVRKNYRIEETLIESKRRYSYEEAQQVIESGKGDNAALIIELHKLAKTLFALRMKNGGIDFETQEVKFIPDENQMPVRAIVKTRTDATSLVEECMLAANRTVAEHLHVLKQTWKTKDLPPYVYRIHDQPDKEKMEAAVGVVRALVLTCQVASSPLCRSTTSSLKQPTVLRSGCEHPVLAFHGQGRLCRAQHRSLRTWLC
ncbi:MAG: RNB domain-containing ribonuclease [Ignavibacteria bacterium]|nr:RNB domain-containing ribonuclease [Ignavibacteria bacterium]